MKGKPTNKVGPLKIWSLFKIVMFWSMGGIEHTRSSIGQEDKVRSREFLSQAIRQCYGPSSVLSQLF